MKTTGRADRRSHPLREIQKSRASGSVISTLRRHRRSFKAKYSVKTLGVFGSIARGEEKKSSDVDILVEFELTPDLLTFVRFADELEAILRRKVDLVRPAALRAEIKEAILREAIFI